MLPYILAGIAALILLLVVVVAMQPAAFRIERSAAMAAPPSAAFALVNDFHEWRAWSPWENVDPNLQRTYEGPTAGVGASYAWKGIGKAGQGRMTITESRPTEHIQIRLEFLKPFKATNTVEFAFQPEGAGTRVAWSMSGTRGFVFKAFGLLMSMEKMVGPDFEKGLAAMKGAAEGKS